MRFAAAATVAFAGLTAAREMSLLQRQVQTIVDVLTGVNGLVGNLDATITAWTGGSPQPVIDASTKIIDACTKGTDAINAAAVITVNDALQVQKVVQTLQATVTKAVTDLVAKKDQAKTAQLGGEAYKQLKLQYDAAKLVSAAVTTKVPQSLATVANNLSQGILAAIQKGIDAFQDISTQVYPGQLSTGSGAGALVGAAAAGSNSTSAPTASHAPTPASTGAASTSASSSAPKSSESKAAAAGLNAAGGLTVVAAAALAVFAL